jgi:flagellar hook assembly protein FlgD
VRVRAEDVLGESEPSEAVLVGTGRLVIAGATPNPANDGCRFDIFIPGTGEPVGATAKIVDASGRLVQVLHEDFLSRGSHTLRWDTSSAEGASVPSGIYFYVVEVDGMGKDSGKIMVLR